MISSSARTLTSLVPLFVAAACAEPKPEVLRFELKNVNVSCAPAAGIAKTTCVVSADAVTAARRPFTGVVAVMDGDTVIERAIVPISSGRGSYRSENLEAGTTPHISVIATGIVAQPVEAAANVSGVTTTCAEEPTAGTGSVRCTARGQIQYSDKGNYLAIVEVTPNGATPIPAFARLQAGTGSFSAEWKGAKPPGGAAPVVEVAAMGIVVKDPR